MKTEPTEAYIIAKRLFDYEDEPILESDICEIADIAFHEGQSSPKIKQLDQLGWLEQSNGLIYTPHVFGITYCIYEEKGMWWIHCQFYNNYENISTDFASTLDEAKALAQADFEKRVMECLL